MPQRRAAFWLVALLVVLFFLVRWNTFTAPFERDEGEYAYSAWLMQHSAVPYIDSFLQKPPMILYLYLAGQTIAGDFVWVPRVLAVLFVAGATLALARLARREFGEGADLTVAWLATPMLALPSLLPFAANTESFMLLPLVGALLTYARNRGRAAPWEWFAAGCCAAFSVLFKPIDVYVLAFVGVVWIVETWIDRRNLKFVFLCVVCGASGALLTAAIVLGWFLMKGAGRALWAEAVTFNLHYARLLGENTAALGAQMRTLWNYWVIVLLLPLWLLIRRPGRWWFYLGLVATAFIGIYQSRNGHYYLLLAPFLALGATAAIQDIFARVHVRGARVAFVAVTAVILFLPSLSLIGLTPNEMTERLYDSRNPFVESPIVARRIADLTRPEDRVYIAGSEPQILYDAQRRSSTRFVISYPLMLDTPLASGYQRETLRELNEHPPAAVVFVSTNLSWSRLPTSPNVFLPYLMTMLHRDYTLIGGFVRGRETTGWVEPLQSDQVLQCSLLVFQRTSSLRKFGR